MRVTESRRALGAVSSITAEQTTTARAGAVFALQLERDMQQIATLLSALVRGRNALGKCGASERRLSTFLRSSLSAAVRRRRGSARSKHGTVLARWTADISRAFG